MPTHKYSNKNNSNDMTRKHRNRSSPAIEVSLLSKFYYPCLVSKHDLIRHYPWTNTRITYHYIIGLYREPNNSVSKCVKSLFQLHNELINSWTHVIGSAIAFFNIIRVISHISTHNPCFFSHLIFNLSAVFMLLNSASYHIFCCHSDQVSRLVQCQDWLGIAVYAFGSNFITSYYLFSSSSSLLYSLYAVNGIFAFVTYSITYSALQSVFVTTSGKHPVPPGESGRERERDREKERAPNRRRVSARRNGSPISDDGEVSRGISSSPLSSWFSLSLLTTLLESYSFRTVIAVLYACGSLFQHLLYVALRDTFHSTFYNVVAIYACFSAVVLCLLDLPEALLPPGSVDLLGASHQLFHCGILAGYLITWSTYYNLEMQL